MDNKEQNMAKLHNEEAHNKRYQAFVWILLPTKNECLYILANALRWNENEYIPVINEDNEGIIIWQHHYKGR